MSQGQPVCVQEQALGWGATIPRISQYRVADGGEVYAKLMGASGLQYEIHGGEVALVSKSAEPA